MKNRIRLVKPSYSEITLQNVKRVLESGNLVQGEVLARVEQQFQSYLGCEYGLLVSSGTSALQLAFMFHNIGEGDNVIVPAFSYVASAHVVEATGAQAVFVDVQLDDFNIDVSKIEEKINSRTKAILVVHEFGMPANMEAMNKLAESYGLKIIEDAACAMGSAYKGEKLGSGNNLTCFSFHPRKVITSGEGGLITSNRKEEYDKLKALRSHGWDNSGKVKYVGLNYRMTEFQAIMLEEQLVLLDDTIRKRNEIASYFDKHISTSLLRTPKVKEQNVSNWQSYHILCKSTEIRNASIERLRAAEIEASYGAQCIPIMDFYKNKYGFTQDDFPNALKAYTCGLVIPNHENLNENEQQRIVGVLNDIKE